MSLTRSQLAAIVARALPDERLRDSRQLADNRYALMLDNGERLNVLLCATGEEANTAAAALRLLRSEIDMPFPQLRASDPNGETVGSPYVLVDDMPGEPLAKVVGQMSEDQIYRLGRRVGEMAQRIHRLAAPRYGALESDKMAAADERSFVLAHLGANIERGNELGVVDRRFGGDIRDWFEEYFKPAGRQPALTHGGISPDTILVRQSGSNWQISGLLGWGNALGWCPAWEHVTFLELSNDPRCFGLRVGYGNSYDDLTQRTYEQVREHAMAPYRVLFVLNLLLEAVEAGDFEEIRRRRSTLRGLMGLLAAS